MNLNDMIEEYNEAIETDKVLEGQYKVLENQLSKLLLDLGMTYEEALKREEELRDILSKNLPKIQKYIQDVAEKKQSAEESFV